MSDAKEVVKEVAKPVGVGLGLHRLHHLHHHHFWGGALVGAAAVKFLSTKKARDLAVKGLAAGMNLKEDAKEKWICMKEEAEELHEEAKRQAQENRLAEGSDQGQACCSTEE